MYVKIKVAKRIFKICNAIRDLSNNKLIFPRIAIPLKKNRDNATRRHDQHQLNNHFRNRWDNKYWNNNITAFSI